MIRNILLKNKLGHSLVKLSVKEFRGRFSRYIEALQSDDIRTLDKCYVLCSNTKWRAWQKWQNFNDSLLKDGFWTTPLQVASFSFQFVSFEMVVGVPGSSESYYLLITPCTIKCYPLVTADMLYLDAKIGKDLWEGSFKDELKGARCYTTRSNNGII